MEAEQFYTETIVTDVMTAEDYYGGAGAGAGAMAGAGAGAGAGTGAGGKMGLQHYGGQDLDKPTVRIKVRPNIASQPNYLGV